MHRTVDGRNAVAPHIFERLTVSGNVARLIDGVITPEIVAVSFFLASIRPTVETREIDIGELHARSDLFFKM